MGRFLVSLPALVGLAAVFPQGSCECAGKGIEALGRLNLPEDVRQVILVRTLSFESPYGRLAAYSRSGRTWKLSIGPFPVVTGEKGLAWGRGRHTLKGNVTPQKVEGDGRGPAGIFELGDAFGYAPEPPPGCRLPYRTCTTVDFFVDDPSSPCYNTWVRVPGTASDSAKKWKSAEAMCIDWPDYEIGIVVKHNMNPVSAGGGSAIFLHVWSSGGASTLGCTAMSRGSMLRLLKWLAPARHPLLIQLPVSEMKRLGKDIRFLP